MDNAKMPERKIRVLYPIPKIPQMYKRIAIYCRVSTHHSAQEDSLNAQIDRFQKMVEARFDWTLAKTYSDIASGRNTTGRSEFTDLMSDCRAGKIDLIITKSISRFGRNTVDILSNVRELKALNVDVFFDAENMYASESASELMLSIISAVAQEDSAAKSQNIRMGIEYQLANGTSRLYSRPCYGYKKNDKGNLIIDEKQADNVRLIFGLYLKGHSVLSIIRELKLDLRKIPASPDAPSPSRTCFSSLDEPIDSPLSDKTASGSVLNVSGRCEVLRKSSKKRRVKSPSGKAIWSKRAVETLLANEKYVGDILVGKTFKEEFPSSKRRVYNGGHGKYELKNSHEPIIQRDIFDRVQQERRARSNIGIDDGKAVRKNTRYSMKSPAMKKVA